VNQIIVLGFMGRISMEPFIDPVSEVMEAGS